MTPINASRIGAPDPPGREVWLAPVTVMLGSLVTLVPVIATVPFLPPFGLMLLIAWRLRRPDCFKTWAAVPLGLFDDLVSGQPLGSAMLLWTIAYLAIDIVDARLVWRSFWHDFAIAAGGVAFVLVAGRLVATGFTAHVDTVLLVQILIAMAFYPLIALLVARWDPRVAE